MSILNYTTKISADKTISEIMAILNKHRAQAILTEYEDGTVTALSFRIKGPHGVISYRLPGNISKVFTVLKRTAKRSEHRTMAQAARVGWRIVKDWLAAQLAIVQAEMVTLEQVLLPWAQDAEGKTVYEVLTAKRFEGLALSPA